MGKKYITRSSFPLKSISHPFLTQSTQKGITGKIRKNFKKTFNGLAFHKSQYSAVFIESVDCFGRSHLFLVIIIIIITMMHHFQSAVTTCVDNYSKKHLMSPTAVEAFPRGFLCRSECCNLRDD